MYNYPFSNGAMFGNPMANDQAYMSELQRMKDAIDQRMNQVQQGRMPMQTVTPVNQTFQLNPMTSNNIRFVETEEEVRNQIVPTDSLFVNKAFSLLWLKTVDGSIKTYELKEQVKMDEKDKKIEALEKQLQELMSMNKGGTMNNVQYDANGANYAANTNANTYEYNGSVGQPNPNVQPNDGIIKNAGSSNVQHNKSSKK